MSGATVPVHTRPPTADDRGIPILVAAMADSTFGPLLGRTEFRQSYRVVVSSQGVGLQGETDEGVSYAIYELLEELGCRWYMPGEMGEVVPRRATVALAERDVTLSPRHRLAQHLVCRRGLRRRNRLGGFAYSAGHALEGYVSKEQLEQHPDWNAEIGGKRQLHRCDVGYRICWANPEVSAAVADAIIARAGHGILPRCVSISPRRRRSTSVSATSARRWTPVTGTRRWTACRSPTATSISATASPNA